MALRVGTRPIRLQPWILLVLALGPAGLTSCGSAASQPHSTVLPAAAKIVVDADGITEVSSGALQEAGIDAESVGAQNLTLSTGGQPVAFLLTGEGTNRALRFYGQGLSASSYDGHNVYLLAADPGSHSSEAAGNILSALPAEPAPGLRPAEVVSDTVHVEEQRQYLSQVGSGDDRWFWQPLFAPAEIQLVIRTPHAASGSGELRLRVWGSSSAAVNPDHRLLLSLNGIPVADHSWDGVGAHVITATVQPGLLQPGDNKLTVTAPGNTGAKADSLLVDWAEISYLRELILDDASFEFRGQAPGFTVRVPGGAESRSLVVWDITNPTRPASLTGYRVEDDRLTFASDNTLRRYLISTPAGVRQPSAIVPAAKTDLPDWPGGADMIVVTVPEFREALEPLVAERRSAGLRVAVVDVSEVYDAFTNGRAGPEAIRALVRHAVAHWTPPAPRFLLLAGDASYDPHGYLKGPEHDLVPTQLVNTAFTGWTASDVWYAVREEETGADQAALEPLLAVGRFPAQTAEQIGAMVAKTLAYEREQVGAPWNESALLLVDNDDPGFEVVADRFANNVGQGYRSEIVVLTGDGSLARRRLLQALDEGVGLLGYFGHGSMTLWAQEKIFDSEDVPSLANRDHLPIVFTVTCLSGLFNHPAAVSLGEELLRADNGGAVAALVPSSAGGLPDQRFLADALARSLAKARTPGNADTSSLGQAIQSAQAELPKESAGAREMGLTFNLLGDPSLSIAR
jgi:hypothetical protein